MPTYDYKCLACDVRFEKFQGITAPALEECPECGGKVKRLIGAGAGLIFKGSGFYTTDYRSDGYKESAKKDKKESSDKSSSSDKSEKKEKKTADTSSESKSKSTDSE
ncbi:zinc ribbon domain-containing protein [Candidatus Poribacteria bacterium]|nr:zinc ribbon domain-containing protein [Candidatus Poribacteria bacterium]MYG06470.1 zinc ribbon domain-containing protein [Candidatus Poribacteria bacterium]MYK23837.1 zinc ribbon domain-containing protein [Candidatus Poribacteria bacterium]